MVRIKSINEGGKVKKISFIPQVLLILILGCFIFYLVGNMLMKNISPSRNEVENEVILTHQYSEIAKDLA